MKVCKNEGERACKFYCIINSFAPLRVLRCSKDKHGTCEDWEGQEVEIVEDIAENKKSLDTLVKSGVIQKGVSTINGISAISNVPKVVDVKKENIPQMEHIPKVVDIHKDDIPKVEHFKSTINGISTKNGTLPQKILDIELTPAQIASLLSVERHTIQRWLKTGKLKSNRLIDVITLLNG